MMNHMTDSWIWLELILLMSDNIVNEVKDL